MAAACFDSHVHFATDDDSVAAQVARAAEAGVTRLLAVGGSPAMNRAALAAARRFPGQVAAAVGLDRHLAAELAGAGPVADALVALEREITDAAASGTRLAAFGEIGLDYHYEPETAEAQRVLFASGLALARRLRLPAIVHSREADDDTLAILREHAQEAARLGARPGVLHCYTGGRAFAEHLLELGLCISFSGILTFRNANPLREVAAALPADRLLVETDSPYLAPAPHRGKPNEPAFLPDVIRCLARERGTDFEAIAALTFRHAEALFG